MVLMSHDHIERRFPIEELAKLTYLNEMKEDQADKKTNLKIQLMKAGKNFKEKMKTQSLFERDFMKMFKMQVDIQQEDFDKLEFKFQIRFLCFFFCNFVDKILTLYFFKDFWSEVKIFQQFSTVQTK
jgi:hypothetical protein